MDITWDIATLVRLRADVEKILNRYHEKERYGFLRQNSVVVIDNLPALSDDDTPHRACIITELDAEDRAIFDLIYATQHVFVIPDEESLPIAKTIDVTALNGEYRPVAHFDGPVTEADTNQSADEVGWMVDLLADEDDLRLLMRTLEALPYEYEEAD